MKEITFLLSIFGTLLCGLLVFAQTTVSEGVSGINTSEIFKKRQAHSCQLSQNLTATERVLILKNLRNEKSVQRITELKDELMKSTGNKNLEMKLNERLVRELKLVENLSDDNPILYFTFQIKIS